MFGRLPGFLFLWWVGISVVWGLDLESGRLERVWTVPEAVRFALENNPDARLARERLRGAEAVLDRARAGYSPRFSVGSGYEMTDGSGRAFGWIVNQRAFDPAMDFNRLGRIDNWNLHGMVTLPVYDGGRRAGFRDSALAGIGVAEAEREVAELDLVFGVVRTFLEIHRADQVVIGLEALMESLGEAVSVAEARVEGGALQESDALHLRVNRLRVEEELVRARHVASMSRRAFVNLLGLPYEEPRLEIPRVGELIPVPEMGEADPPELRAARSRIKAAEGSVAAARGLKKPRIDLYGRVDRDEGWETGKSGGHWSAGIGVTYELWDGGDRAGAVRLAVAERRAAYELERKVALAVEDEVVRARLALEEAEVRKRVAEEAVRHAEENVRLARIRFGQGNLLSNQLSEAEAGFTEARVRLVLAETDVWISVAALRRVLGVFPVEMR